MPLALPISVFSVPCLTNIIISLKECFGKVRFVLVQNSAFDIINAGKKNMVLIFVIGTVEFKMKGYFCFQATGSKRN